jgi:putative addiction module killer protein
MVKFEIYKYESEQGSVPYDVWFDKLDTTMQARIDARLDRLSLGNFGDCKSVGDRVYELRFFFGPGYRVYFGRYEKVIILLLTGGDKKTQKNDIKLAKELMNEFVTKVNANN